MRRKVGQLFAFVAGFAVCMVLQRVWYLGPVARDHLLSRSLHRTAHLTTFDSGQGLRGKAGGSSVQLAWQACDTRQIRLAFDTEQVESAAERAWQHLLNLHATLAGMLDQRRFTLQHSYAHFDLLLPAGPKCKERLVTIGEGRGKDNDKKFCGNALLQDPACVIISVGSHNEVYQRNWGFEAGAFHQTACVVHVFDCTCDSTHGCRYDVPDDIKSRVFFHSKCLGVADHGEFLSWTSLLSHAGLREAPTLLKIDIEGWEYSALTGIVDKGEMMPQQIAVEFHWITGGVGGPYWRNRSLPALMANAHNFAIDKSFLQAGRMQPYKHPPTYSYKTPGEMGAFGAMLFLKGGYLVVDRKDNPDCPHCCEMLLARVVCPQRPH